MSVLMDFDQKVPQMPELNKQSYKWFDMMQGWPSWGGGNRLPPPPP